jgi:hypothetical protein
VETTVTTVTTVTTSERGRGGGRRAGAGGAGTGGAGARAALAAGLAGVLVAAAAAGPCRGQTKTGTALAQFLGIEPGSRPAAMGNAGVALEGGIQSVYYNPGTLGAVERTAVQVTHGAWFADIAYDYAAVALPLTWGTLFGSVTSLNSGEIEVRTVAQPLGTGERYTVSDVALAFGYGRHVTPRFAAGMQVNYVSETIWHTSASTVTFSGGTVYELTSSGIKLGASLSNLGTRARFRGRDLAIQFDADPDEHGDNSALPGEQLTDRFPVPILFRFGVSVPYPTGERSRLLLVADALHPSDNTESLSLGAEWRWQQLLAFRAGYQSLWQEDSELGLTLGAGLAAEVGELGLELDYAWATHEHLDETHRVTVVLEF